VKVRDVLSEWPPRKWAADDLKRSAVSSDPGKLRLLWFSLPDVDGWFSLTATDAQGASWSAYCRAPANLWRPIERALAGALRVPLELVGDIELDATNVSPPDR
jgi:hypothetical protein